MSEFLSTVIKSCRANFRVKWRVFFSTTIFVQKCQFWGKKLKFCEKCWLSQTIVHYYWKSISYWKTCLFSENCDFLSECLCTLRNCQILIKTSIFLRNVYLYSTCVNFHLSISFVGKLLFWFKISFHSVIFWKKCHFPSKIYISGGINFFWRNRAIFLRKGVNLAVNFGKNDSWY